MEQGKRLLGEGTLATFISAAPIWAHDDLSHGSANHANFKDERKALNPDSSQRAMLVLELPQHVPDPCHDRKAEVKRARI